MGENVVFVFIILRSRSKPLLNFTLYFVSETFLPGCKGHAIDLHFECHVTHCSVWIRWTFTLGFYQYYYSYWYFLSVQFFIITK